MAARNIQEDLGEKTPNIRPSSSDSDSVLSEATTSSTPQEEEINHESRPHIARTVTGKSSIIPRSQRRGMLGQLGLVPEIENPKEYSGAIKDFITILVAAGGAAAPMASAILFRE